MNIEKINETILELKKELENKRKNVKTREIVKDGCSCGNNKVTHKQTIKKSSKAKKIYVCENCKENPDLLFHTTECKEKHEAKIGAAV